MARYAFTGVSLERFDYDPLAKPVQIQSAPSDQGFEWLRSAKSHIRACGAWRRSARDLCLRSVGKRLNRLCFERPRRQRVMLHVYDVGTVGGVTLANEMFNAMGTGIYHAAVEIYGLEWSFAYKMFGHGIFCCQPGQCALHRYRESIHLGFVKHSKLGVQDVLCEMVDTWVGASYNTLRKNCCHFCDEFALKLGLDSIPRWVLNLAGAAETVQGVLTFQTVRRLATSVPLSSPLGSSSSLGSLGNKQSNAVSAVMSMRRRTSGKVLPPIEREGDSEIKFPYMAPGVTELQANCYVSMSKEQRLYDVIGKLRQCMEDARERVASSKWSWDSWNGLEDS